MKVSLASAALASVAAAVELSGYDYIVVGAGAGGGPLAARLAMAGHKTLLIEAGGDPGVNVNYTVPAYSAKSSEDETMAWNFFVRHYADDERQARDYKTTYETSDGQLYTGLHPPPGARMLGTLYPRAAALGGCSVHNALVTVYPHRSDFDALALLTGDASWSAKRMRRYFARLERNRYLLPGLKGHGYDGWLSTETAPLTIALTDPELLSMILGGAFALGNYTNTLINLATVVAGDANADTAERDRDGGFFQVPLSARDGVRVSPREFILAVRDARNADGSRRYPLDVRTNCHVTRVVFDTSGGGEPRATGVEFLDGAHLYRASPRHGTAGRGVPGSARAAREVILAGGVYNSPQLLKLSGVGPADELARHGIPLVRHLPGVGANLQDHYEVAVQGRLPGQFASLAGCTFTSRPGSDPCLQRWQSPPLLLGKGTYGSNGLPVAMMFRSSAAAEYDIFAFGGPVNFRGYFPGYSVNITADHDLFTWSILKAHPRNRAGSVTLRSADPLDVPDILFNSFADAESAADLAAMREAVRLARDAFARQPLPVAEVLPGAAVQTDAEIERYIRDTAWSHHASSTCPIGRDDDPAAVLDARLRVRGVGALRVVDASVFPRIPGTFTALSTYMLAEKAADLILGRV